MGTTTAGVATAGALSRGAPVAQVTTSGKSAMMRSTSLQTTRSLPRVAAPAILSAPASNGSATPGGGAMSCPMSWAQTASKKLSGSHHHGDAALRNTLSTLTMRLAAQLSWRSLTRLAAATFTGNSHEPVTLLLWASSLTLWL